MRAIVHDRARLLWRTLHFERLKCLLRRPLRIVSLVIGTNLTRSNLTRSINEL